MNIALNQRFEAPYETIKIVRYAKDGNTVISKKVKAQNIGNNFYATEPREGDTDNGSSVIFISIIRLFLSACTLNVPMKAES